MQKRSLVWNRITSTTHPPSQITVSKEKKSGGEEPLEYVVDNIVNHRHKLKIFLYKVRWYEYSPEEAM